MQVCTGNTITLTSTNEPVPVHKAGDPHMSGNAIDLRYPSDPDKYLCCAKQCGAKYALDEKRHPSPKSTGQHFYLQTTPAPPSWPNDLPSDNDCKCKGK